MITILHCDGAAAVATGHDPAILPALLAGDAPFWLSLDAPEAAEFCLLTDVFHFHPLAVEDATKPHQRPKVDEYEGYFFLVADEASLGSPDTEPENNGIQSRQIATFVGANYLVTINTGGASATAELATRCQRHPQLLKHGPDFLLYMLLDRLVDGYFPLLDTLDERVDDLENRIVRPGRQDILETIFSLKKSVTRLRRLVGPLREVTQALTTRNFQHVQDSTIPYLRDVSDHLFRIYETLDGYRDVMSNMLDAYLSQLNNQISQVMQKLAAVATVFMPITFLTGVFGMNFNKQPWAGTNAWDWFGLMAVIAIGMFAWLRRRRWF